MTREDVFELADSLFFTFMDNLCDSDVKEFIEDDPNNKEEQEIQIEGWNSMLILSKSY